MPLERASLGARSGRLGGPFDPNWPHSVARDSGLIPNLQTVSLARLQPFGRLADGIGQGFDGCFSETSFGSVGAGNP
jgi:hypothetical protein